ncbi:hypothetical protein Tco_1304817 [Tanacetum coccineum]
MVRDCQHGLLYSWGDGSRVDEMILARERSGFAEEKIWGALPVVTGFWGGKEDFLGELAVWSPEDVRIRQKSQENRQKRSNTKHENGRACKSQKPKSKSQSSQSTMGQQSVL